MENAAERVGAEGKSGVRAGSGAGRGAVLGAGVVAGWVLYDVTAFAGSGCAAELLPLAPLSLAWVAAGAVFGAAVGAASARVALLPWVLAALALAAAPRSVAGVILPEGVSLLLPRVLALLLVAVAAGGWVLRRWRIGALRLGLAAGVLAAFALGVHQWRTADATYGAVTLRSTWALAAMAAAQVAAGAIRRPGPRAVVTVLLVLVALPPMQARARRMAPGRMRADLAAPAVAATQGARNLVLVVLDTVRADHLSCYGYDRPTTPGLDAFAREHATLYTQARSTSPFTMASHASLFTGLLPAQHGSPYPYGWAQALDTPHPTIAERLRERGYRTGAVVANCAWLNPGMRMDRGFERFDSRRVGFVGGYTALAQLMGGKAARRGRSSTVEAERITDRAIQWLEQVRGERPFFLMLNYLDAHSPYLPPPDRARLFADGPRLEAANPEFSLVELLYDRELHYLDEHVARLLEHLEGLEEWDETVVVVTADHGEALGEHGLPEHCWTLYDAMVRVPLLVKPAGGRAERTVDEPIHGAEVHDLMLELLGLEPPPREPERPFFGEWYPMRPAQELFEIAQRLEEPDRDLLAWVEGSVKTIVSSTGKVEAYDVLRDPRELSPLALTPAEVEQALRLARAWWSEHPLEPPAEARVPEAGEAQLLRDLGYAGN